MSSNEIKENATTLAESDVNIGMGDNSPSIARNTRIGSDDLIKNPSDKKSNPPIVKGCFIATAAMGSALHPHVQLLRDFRDDILLKSRYKETFENLLNRYYLFSPPIAKSMENHVSINITLRYALVYPIVFGIKMILPVLNVILGIERDARRRN